MAIGPVPVLREKSVTPARLLPFEVHCLSPLTGSRPDSPALAGLVQIGAFSNAMHCSADR